MPEKFWRAIHFLSGIVVKLSYKKYLQPEGIDEDMKRYCPEGQACGKTLHRLLVGNKLFRVICFYRLNKTAPKLCRVLKCFYPPMEYIGIDVKELGGGFGVFHGYSTIVFAEKIGKNCTVYQQVTVGRGKMTGGRDIPVIGDNVTIFAGAKVIGGITIGNNCKIGANAVVLHDVPDDCTVAGVPARIVKRKGPNDGEAADIRDCTHL